MSLDSCGWTSDPPAVGLSVSAGFVGVVDGVAVGVAVAASVVGGVTAAVAVGVTAGCLGWCRWCNCRRLGRCCGRCDRRVPWLVPR